MNFTDEAEQAALLMSGAHLGHQATQVCFAFQFLQQWIRDRTVAFDVGAKVFGDEVHGQMEVILFR